MSKGSNQEWDRHPEHDTILMSLEGELAEPLNGKVQQHLRACWACRANAERLQRGMMAFAEYRLRRLIDDLEAPPRQWDDFTLLLHQASQEETPVSQRLLTRVRAIVRSLTQFPSLSPRSVATSLSTLLFGVLILWALWRPNPLGASMFLRQLQVHQVRPASMVLHQRVRIASKSYSVVRDVYSDRSTPLQPAASGGAAELARVLTTAGWSWDHPFDVDPYLRWRADLKSWRDQVTSDSTKTSLSTADERASLPVEAGSMGRLQQVTLAVRTADWHLLDQLLEFSNGEQIEITELNSELLSAPEHLKATMPSASPLAARVTDPVSEPPVPAAGLVASAAALAEAEVAAREAVHLIRGDLGEPVSYANSGLAIEVSALVDTPRRKQEFLDALTPLPLIEPHIRSADELEIDAAPAASSTVILVAPEPLLETQLEVLFPKPADRAEYINELLAASQRALDYAWAFRRLDERYSAGQMAGLSPVAQTEISRLGAGYLQAYLENVDVLIRRLPALIGEQARDEAPPGVVDGVGLTVRTLNTHQLLRAALSGPPSGPVDLSFDAASIGGYIDSGLAAQRSMALVLQTRFSPGAHAAPKNDKEREK